jgi:hypothetical protein
MQDESAKEKRAIRRFTLQLPVTVTARSGEVVQKNAETRDVSSHGICFYCDTALEKQSTIEFTVTLPTDVTMTEPISVRCRGTVVRVDGDGSDGKYAIAAAIDTYEFVANDENQFFLKAVDAQPSQK